ncbi:hypothetical protein LTR95_004868 [Oleoguttula sp. CCFEE 5521]
MWLKQQNFNPSALLVVLEKECARQEATGTAVGVEPTSSEALEHTCASLNGSPVMVSNTAANVAIASLHSLTATIPGAEDDTKFIARVQGLTPELFNIVLDYTLRQPPGPLMNRALGHAGSHITTIDRASRPPTTLQVDRASREIGAKIYYGTNIFQYPRYDDTEVLADCLQWLDALPLSHVKHITHIRLEDVAEFYTPPADFSSVWQGLKAGIPATDLVHFFEGGGTTVWALIRRIHEFTFVYKNTCIGGDCRLGGLIGLEHEYGVAACTKLYASIEYTTGDKDGVHIGWWPVLHFEPAEMVRMIEGDFRPWNVGPALAGDDGEDAVE